MERLLTRSWILLTLFVAVPAYAEGIMVDFGDHGTYAGYAKELQPLPGDAQKVVEYHWVCPPESHRPPDGIVTVQLSDVDSRIVTLGKRQCWNDDEQRVVDMVKEYNRAYYVVGGKTGDLQGADADHGGSGAAAAARAAGAAAGGYYNACTPDPFALCSGPEPDARNPMHACWDAVCPIGR